MVTTPYLRAMSIAVFSEVPAPSMNVSGRDTNGSVSFEAIHTNRGDNGSFLSSLPAWTMWYRTTPSAVAHPTHDPGSSWSPTPHHDARRSTLAGSAATAPNAPAATASSNCQSCSMPREGTKLQIRSC